MCTYLCFGGGRFEGRIRSRTVKVTTDGITDGVTVGGMQTRQFGLEFPLGGAAALNAREQRAERTDAALLERNLHT